MSAPAASTVSSTVDPITLTRFMLHEQAQIPEAQGDLTLLLTSIQLAIKVIASQVRSAGVSAQISGLAGAQNSSGDDQKKLDVIANDIFVNALRFSTKLCCMVRATLKLILMSITRKSYFPPVEIRIR